MKRLVLISFLFASLAIFAADNGKRTRHKNGTAPIEAVITKAVSGCGYLLRLNNGKLLLPVNLPEKFQKPGEKVVLVVDELKTVYNSPCGVQKEVHISKIRLYELEPGEKTKY